MFKPILIIHIAAGSIALASMWIPLLARKGSRLHRRAGWVFVTAMAVIAVSAIVLAGGRLFLDPRPDAKASGVFLLYIAVLTATAVSSGVRALRVKQRTRPHRHWWDLGLPALLTATSVGVAGFGLITGSTLFTVFAGIGAINGINNLRYWLATPSDKMHWWFAHMNGMLGGSIAAVTAFFVVNADNLGLPQLAAWLSPSIVGTAATAVWIAYYKKRFANGSVVAMAAAPGMPASADRIPGAIARPPSRRAAHGGEASKHADSVRRKNARRLWASARLSATRIAAGC